MTTAPTFSLLDTDGQVCMFPSEKASLLCFVKSDCPTCLLTLPLIESVSRALPSPGEAWVISQDSDGGRGLRDRLQGNLRVLDDSQLRVSYDWGLEFVPTVVTIDSNGVERARFAGFSQADWQALLAELGEGATPPVIDWAAYPENRPGCGSRSAAPEIAERLRAESEDGPLRARRLELGEAQDAIEFLYEQGLTDGLPVVPPTPERVLRMLSGTGRSPQEIVATLPPKLTPVNVEKVAINAVLAGCLPEYLPVILAAVEAVCTDEFNLHGVLATTYFTAPVIIVNGPIRDRIGMNYGVNCLGQGNRANATIGRALQLVVRNVGGGRPGEIDMATFGQPGKFSFCFAEHEERNPWEPLHVERGFERYDDTVTVIAGSGPCGFIDQLSRSARSLATSYGMTLAATTHPKFYGYGQVALLIPPEHVDTFQRDGWSKDQIREHIQETTKRPVRELVHDQECAEGLPIGMLDQLGADTEIPKFRSIDDIAIVVAGGEAGKFGAIIQGWAAGPSGSVMTTRRIGE